ncbi:hypothetical protein RFI_04048 [Reticulomyxa filosa]|uniref:Calcium-dependent protein kinase n=1 Tax=Reticulomyxa filosa TaxID=46433 RepID=X6P4Q4_RETFI|nr:hypothetical protein RFI_04048 [Reticulomyxa filosa]|eukprot:ETO33059.1 hypothetical protein RFI_04048 [Reticulomyxa filosa]
MGNCFGSSRAEKIDDAPQSKTEEKTSSQQESKTGIQSRYLFKNTLGKGASCRVVAAELKTDKSRKLAVKIMSKERSVSAKLFELECELLGALSDNGKTGHKNVVRFVEKDEDEQNYYVVTSLLEGGELFDRIVSKDEKYIITEKKAADLIRSMCEAVQYCHQHNVVHRDLKPENFVLESTSADSNVVLIDFGCGTLVDPNDTTKTYDNLVGTAYYLAPELAYLALSKSRDPEVSRKFAPFVKPRTAEVLKAADVWSIGVIAYVMLTGRAPFRGRTNSDIFESIVTNEVEYPEHDARYKTALKLNPAFKDFIEKALVKDPSKRLSIEECIRHPWVQGIKAGDWALNNDVIRFLRQFNYQSKLKKEVTKILAANMNSEPSDQIRQHFVRLDADGDGYLDDEELSFLLLDMGYAKTNARKEATEIIKQADQNGDHVIDFEEFKTIWYRKILSTNDQYINRVFNVFDANGDGQIDVNELKQVLMPAQANQDEQKDSKKDDDIIGQQLQHLIQMIEEVDTNGDKMISLEEFQKAMKEDLEKTGFSPSSFQVGGGVTDDQLKKLEFCLCEICKNLLYYICNHTSNFIKGYPFSKEQNKIGDKNLPNQRKDIIVIGRSVVCTKFFCQTKRMPIIKEQCNHQTRMKSLVKP